MKHISVRTITALTALSAQAVFSAAILPGFNTTSDGRSDDGTYTTGGCNNAFAGGTCAGTLVPIGFSINFYGTSRSDLYINTNGNVTFDAALGAFSPFSLDDAARQMIAPFFADLDTRNPASGVITFGNGTYEGRPTFGVNYIDMGFFDTRVDVTNSFQLLLVDRSETGFENFDIIFNYDRVLWETGDGNFGLDGLGGQSARVGFTNGTGLPGESLELPGSGVAGAFIDGGTAALISNRLNSNVDGRYIFNIRNGVVSEVPEPGSILMVGAGIAMLHFRRRKLRN